MSDEQITEDKLCPFCGSKHTPPAHDIPDGLVTCTNHSCTLRTHWMRIEVWNTRPTDNLEAYKEVVEALKDLIVWEDINPNNNELVDNLNRAINNLNSEDVDYSQSEVMMGNCIKCGVNPNGVSDKYVCTNKDCPCDLNNGKSDE